MIEGSLALKMEETPCITIYPTEDPKIMRIERLGAKQRWAPMSLFDVLSMQNFDDGSFSVQDAGTNFAVTPWGAIIESVTTDTVDETGTYVPVNNTNLPSYIFDPFSNLPNSPGIDYSGYSSGPMFTGYFIDPYDQAAAVVNPNVDPNSVDGNVQLDAWQYSAFNTGVDGGDYFVLDPVTLDVARIAMEGMEVEDASDDQLNIIQAGWEFLRKVDWQDYAQRVFEDSQLGGGCGFKINIKVGPIKIEPAMHSISGSRVTEDGVQFFTEEKFGFTLETGLIDLPFVFTDGEFEFKPQLVINQAKFSLDNLLEVEMGGTVPNPYTGQAINGEIKVHLNEIFKFNEKQNS